MTVRCDRIARTAWDAVPDDERAAIEAAIPQGAYVTLLARTGVNDLTARLVVHGVAVRIWRDRDAARTIRGLLGIAA